MNYKYISLFALNMIFGHIIFCSIRKSSQKNHQGKPQTHDDK